MNLNRVVLNLVLLLLVTYGFYRVVSDVFPHLPWEASAPTPTVSNSPPSGRSTLRIGVSSRPAYLPFYEFKEKATGLDVPVEVVSVPDTGLRWQMLASGRLDLACGTLDSFALALSRHLNVDYLFSIGQDNGEDGLAAGPGIQQIGDLDGKSVAVANGGPGQYYLDLLLDQSGLSPSQVNRVTTATTADAFSLLATGLVQAAVLDEPLLGQARQKNMVILSTTADPKTPRLDEMCAVNPTFLADHKDVLKSLLQAHFRFMEYLKTHPGLARDKVSRLTDVPAGSLGDLLKDVQFASLSDNRALDAANIARRIADAQEKLALMGVKNSAPVSTPESFVKLDVMSEVETPPVDLETPP